MADCLVLSQFVQRWSARGGPKDLIATLTVPGPCAAVQTTRALILLDWRLRVVNPTWYRLVPELVQHAEKLESLSPIWMRSEPTAVAAVAAADAAVAVAAAAAAAAVVVVVVVVIVALQRNHPRSHCHHQTTHRH